MKKLILIAFAVLTASGSIIAQNNTASDEQQIREACRNYVEGWFAGDVERMDKGLHSDLVKQGVNTLPQTGRTFLNKLSKSSMLELTRAGVGKGEIPEGAVDIVIFDIYKSTASAKIVSHKFIDYVHLAKSNDEWSIVNVLWEMNTGE